MIATCPKVRYAKRILKLLDQALKEGCKPKGERKDKEGKPKKHQPSRRVLRRTLVPVRLTRTSLRNPAPVRTRESRKTNPPGSD